VKARTRTTLGIFVTCLLVYHATGRAQGEADTVAAPYTAFSMVRHGSLDLRYYPLLRPHLGRVIRELADGSWISERPPGSALMAVPFMAPFAALGEQPPTDIRMDHLGKLAGACSVAAAAVLMFVICLRLVPSAAWPVTVLFAFGTCMCSVASQALWMHGPATLWLCCALYFLSRANGYVPSCRVAAGLALGLAVLTRPTVGLFALATAGALVAERRWRGLLWLVLGGAVPAGMLCLLNWVYFGDVVRGAYATDNWSHSPPLWLGLSGLLVAPSRGVLVYSPALLLVLPGTIRLIRERDDAWGGLRGVLVAWAIAAGATVVFYARWHDWRGGYCYGPRFLCETMPVLCLLFGIGYAGLRFGWQRRIAVGLVALSVAVHLLGIFGHSGHSDWNMRHDLSDDGRCLFAVEDTQIEAHARAMARKLTLSR